jgi:hypothetical protein
MKTVIRFIFCHFFEFHGLQVITPDKLGRCPWCGKTFDITPLSTQQERKQLV